MVAFGSSNYTRFGSLFLIMATSIRLEIPLLGKQS